MCVLHGWMGDQTVAPCGTYKVVCSVDFVSVVTGSLLTMFGTVFKAMMKPQFRLSSSDEKSWPRVVLMMLPARQRPFYVEKNVYCRSAKFGWSIVLTCGGQP